MSNNKEIKPLYFQISPVVDNNHETQRLCETFFNELFVLVGARGYYRGGNTGAFKDVLEGFINDNIQYPGPLIVCVNTHGYDHGYENTGFFDDKTPAMDT